MTRKPPAPRPHSDRKISETLLDFGQPLLEATGGPPTLEFAQDVMRIIYLIWNGVVLADVHGMPGILAEARNRIAEMPGGVEVLELFVARKRELFGNDARLVGDYRFIRTADGYQFEADYRDLRSQARR